VWDVGHQAYTHKILTGRRDKFNTLRHKGGLSGFPRPEESEYDAFEVGHSSTSIAVALGLAQADKLAGGNNNTIAVIGDGAISGGLAFEALNNASRAKTKLIIVLNDNQMSIAPNVGAMSNYLNDLRTAQRYLDAKSDIRRKLNSIPVIGEPIKNFLGKTKEGLKHTLIPSSVFEDFGLKYIGPIDGHDINQLIHVFNRVKNINEPVIVHIMTKKGKGYKPAEAQPSIYHGVGSFDVEKGVVPKHSADKTYSEIFGEKLLMLASKDSRICAVTAAMPDGTGLIPFSKTYPNRFYDVGIAEEFAVTFSAGLAKGGMLPVFAVYSTFLQRGYDEILHDVCIQRLHVIFAIDRAGIVGSDGETHQGIYDVSYLTHIPNLTVMAPKNKAELEDMLEFAVGFNAPVALRYPRGKASNSLVAVREPIELGKSEQIYEGKEIAVVFYGAMCEIAVNVYAELVKQGYSPELINARFASPIDIAMVDRLNNEFSYVFTLEDNIYSAGFGCLMAQQLIEKGFKGVYHSFAFPDGYVEHGQREELFEKYGLDADSVYNKIMSLISE
jgi:1-deoxy-D-xylulose-5-phosphate synthase